MAHELNFEKGQASMMYIGDVPWHGLGTRLDSPPETAVEAITAARLDWEVGLKPICAVDGSNFQQIPGRHAVVRLDQWGNEDCPIYGMVSDDYRPLQNREAFSFFDPIVGSGKIAYETAGSLGLGERVWILAKVCGDRGMIRVKGNDVVEKYLLLSNGHDGRTAVQVRFTPIRVVCQNTLSMALSEEKKEMFRIHHSPGIHRRLEDAQEAVREILGFYADIEAVFQALADKNLDGAGLDRYVGQVFPDPKPKRGQSDRSHQGDLKRTQAIRTKAVNLFESGKGNAEPGIRHTLWSAYNGVTELVDHHWNYHDRWQRLNFLWFGEGERIKHRALEVAKTMLN